MTNRKLAILLGGVLLMANCAPSHEEFIVAGETAPPSGTTTTCDFTPSTSTLLGEGSLPVGDQIAAQEALGLNQSQVELHYFMDLTVLNTLNAPLLQDSNGQPVNTTNVNDVQITEADATFTTDGTGPSLPDVTVPGAGFIPGPGQGIAAFDLMSSGTTQALVKAFASKTSDFTLIANITLQGLTGGSSVQFSNPFQFPIAVTFEQSVCSDGSTPAFAGPCGNLQDGISALCPDAG